MRGMPRITSSSQLVEQRLRPLQIGRAKSLGEPAIERAEKVARFRSPPLFAPQPGETRRRAQFVGFCLLRLCNSQRILQCPLSLFEPVKPQQRYACAAVKLRLPTAL